MTPAQLVIVKFGGVRPLARLLKIDHSCVCRWDKAKPRGQGGLIPSKFHQQLLEVAKKKGIELNTDDLIYGNRKPDASA